MFSLSSQISLAVIVVSALSALANPVSYGGATTGRTSAPGIDAHLEVNTIAGVDESRDVSSPRKLNDRQIIPPLPPLTPPSLPPLPTPSLPDLPPLPTATLAIVGPSIPPLSLPPASELIPTLPPASDLLPTLPPASDLLPTLPPASDLLPSLPPASDLLPSLPPASAIIPTLPTLPPAASLLPSLSIPSLDSILPTLPPINSILPSLPSPASLLSDLPPLPTLSLPSVTLPSITAASNSTDDTNVAAIAGGVVGGFGGFLLVLSGVIFWIFRRQRKREADSESAESSVGGDAESDPGIARRPDTSEKTIAVPDREDPATTPARWDEVQMIPHDTVSHLATLPGGMYRPAQISSVFQERMNVGY